jgi:cytochrome c biogenesis protein CcdA
MAAQLEDRPRLEDRPVIRPEQRSLASLIGDLAHDATALVRKEIELAKAEMSEKIDKVTGAVGSMAAGGAVLYAGFLVFLVFAVAGLDTILDRWYSTQWLAPLIVSIVVLALGYFMLKAGQKKLEKDALVPRRTLRSLQRDASFIQRESEIAANPDPTGSLRAQRMSEEIR